MTAALGWEALAGDLVAFCWVLGDAFHRQPLTLEEAARWARAEWFEPEHPEELWTLARLNEGIAATRARLKELREWDDAKRFAWGEW